MDASPIAGARRLIVSIASRRGLLAAATGLLAAVPLAHLAGESEAKKHGRHGKNKRRKKHKNKKRKNRKPETRVDATCPEPADFSFSNPDGNNRFAQTFTAKASGPLESAELRISKGAGSPGDYSLRLSPLDGSGVPTNEVLAETTVANADVSDGGSNVPFTFANPFSVKKGEGYALVLTRGEGVFGWGAHSGDACAGRAFQSLDQTAPFTEGPGDGTDFVFTAFVRS